MPAANCAAAARLRTVPPTATRRPSSPSHEALSNSAATCSRSARVCFFLPGAKRSVMRTAPSGHERASTASRSRTRVSCIEPPPRSSTTPSDNVVELTAARYP